MPASISRRIDDEQLLWLTDWSMNELNVPAYPEDRVFARIGRARCVYSRTLDDIVLIIATKPNPPPESATP